MIMHDQFDGWGYFMRIDIAKIMLISYDKDIKFEYDARKSVANKEKHGIDFEEAKKLWTVPHTILLTGWVMEQRFMLIGKIVDKFYTCIFTIRHNNVIRLISVRRSRKSDK